MRELRNVIERAAILSAGEQIGADGILFSFELGKSLQTPATTVVELSEPLAELTWRYEHRLIEQALAQTSAIGAPVVLSTFASSAAVASGLANIARLNGEPTRVVAWAGDGGSYDIGLATLSAAAERNEDILSICYDNEIYGNTGGQRSSSTPAGAVTTTTGGGKVEQKKDLLAIMAAHGIPYAASVSIAHPEDCLRKLRTALDTRGFRFLHLLAPCPTGWKSEPAQGVELVRLAVQCGLFPVVEIIDGDQLSINVEPDFSVAALARYLALQGRFRKAALDPGQLQTAIARHWNSLRLRAACSDLPGTHP